MIVSPCPGPEELRRLIEERLGPVREAEIEAHVETCRPCQDQLEKRVKPANWRAFQLTAIEQRPGAEAAQELGLTVARVFIAKHRVQRMLEEEIRILRGERA